MEVVTGPMSIAQILRDRNNWRRYPAWKGDELEPWTRQVVPKALACRTPALGCHLFLCEDCQIVRLIPHSWKTAFCSSCGAARTDAWCRQLLSDLLEVPYRHLILTLPRELRHLIRVNKAVLLDRLYRAGSRAILALTAGKPRPLPGINRKCMARSRRRFLPGFLIVCHTFASDLKFNPHLHVLVTAGGLSLDHRRWIDAPKRSLVRGQELAREWKKNVIAEIRKAEQQGLLHHPPFRGDPHNPTKVEALLTCVAKKRWWIHIGPSLEEVDRTLRYACRYTRRPTIGEMRILRYDGTNVDFLYTDYADSERKKVMRRSALYFIHSSGFGESHCASLQPIRQIRGAGPQPRQRRRSGPMKAALASRFIFEHGFVAKVPRSRLYRLTPRGQLVLSAALHFRNLFFPEGYALAS